MTATNRFRPFSLNDKRYSIYNDGRVLWLDTVTETATVILSDEPLGQEEFTHDEYVLVFELLTRYPQHITYTDLLSICPDKTLEEMKATLIRAHLKMRSLRVEIQAVLETGYTLIRRYH